jgi:uncharacterized protein (TIGR02301 family)
VRAPLLALLLLVTPVAAQEPAYQQDLLRLAEIMGALSHLEAICGDPDAAVWRDSMDQLITAQGMPPEERRLYVGAFNRGLETFANIHRSCTQQARFAIERYLTEGATISDRIGASYGSDDDSSGT